MVHTIIFYVSTQWVKLFFNYGHQATTLFDPICIASLSRLFQNITGKVLLSTDLLDKFYIPAGSIPPNLENCSCQPLYNRKNKEIYQSPSLHLFLKCLSAKAISIFGGLQYSISVAIWVHKKRNPVLVWCH